MRALKQFILDDCGTTAIEYCLIASIVSIAIVAGAMTIGLALRGDFSSVAAAFP